MRIYDISQPLRVGMPVWPGDQPFEHHWNAKIEDGSSVNLSSIVTSVHTGTHADAPLHTEPGGLSIDQVDLEAYVGPCRVVEYLTDGAIGPDVLEGVDVEATPRLLVRTRLGPPLENWSDEVAYFAPETVEVFAKRGGRLLGIDSPSVDKTDSRDLDSHHAMFANQIMNLENLNLENIEIGAYVLSAAPLRVQGADGAPSRAILIVL